MLLIKQSATTGVDNDTYSAAMTCERWMRILAHQASLDGQSIHIWSVTKTVCHV